MKKYKTIPGRLKLPLVILLPLGLLLALVLPLHPSAQEMRILVVETTDIHGYLMDASSGKEETFQYRMAYLADQIRREKEEGLYDDIILLDGGDLYQGSPVSNLTYGAPMRAALELMGYDAVVLGNHEFDWEVTLYGADQEGTIPPYAIGNYQGDPDIPLLACNLYDAKTKERVPFTQDYCILEKAGVRIAVVGYLPDWRDSILAEKIAHYSIEEDLGKLEELLQVVVEAENPDAIILLTHGEPEPLAQVMDPSQVDLVLGGHSHQIKTGVADNGIPYLQANCYGYGYASAVLVLDGEGGLRVEDAKYTATTQEKSLLYDNAENAPHLDPALMELSHTAWEAVQEQMGEVLGLIDTPVKRPSKKERYGTAGNWVTGLMLKAMEPYGVVAAFYNSGGIRTNLPIPQGEETREVTVYDIYTLVPFGNQLLVYELNGQELAHQLQNGLLEGDYGDQLNGLTFTYRSSKTAEEGGGEEVTILGITLDDGTVVDLEDPEKRYRVCISSYSATLPGSVFEGKEPVIPLAESPVDHEAMVEAIRLLAMENGGYIPVKTDPPGILQEELEDAA